MPHELNPPVPSMASRPPRASSLPNLRSLFLLLAVGATLAVLGSQPVLAQSCATDPLGAKPRYPCQSVSDLHRVMLGQSQYYNNWGHLDSDFSAWTQQGSENFPVIAAAIYLWDAPNTNIGNGHTPVTWLRTFLQCQTGGACSLPSNNKVRYLKGSEVLSGTYDAPVVTAIVAVNLWAHQNNDATLKTYARKYLKMTWALYTLAAGDTPPRNYRHDHFTQQTSSCPPTWAQTQDTHRCMTNSSNQLFYDGPFVAMIGGRQSTSSFCNNDRSTLLARSLQWTFTKSRESYPQRDVLNRAQAQWPGNSQGENVYASDANRRSFLTKIIKEQSYDATTLTQILSGARFYRTIRFLAWPGVRANLMEQNSQKCGRWCTVNTFAAKWTKSASEVHYLYPWPGSHRHDVTTGEAWLSPNPSAPSSIWASNIGPGESATCAHGDVTVSMSLPSQHFLYQVVVGPTFNAYRVF